MLKIPHDGIYGKPNFAHSSMKKSSMRKLFFPFLSLKPHKIYYTNKIDDSVFLYTSQYKLLFAYRIDGNPVQICEATSRRAFLRRLHGFEYSKAFENTRPKIGKSLLSS